MKIRTLLATCITGGAFATTTIYADHNSVWGEDWANMPNDIHNKPIETLGGINSEFIKFVRENGGADSANDAVLDSNVVPPGSRSDTRTMAGSVSRSAARTSMRSSTPAMRIGGRH